MALQIPDSAPLHDVIISAVNTAGLPLDDPGVARAESVLAAQYFLNAASLRFKRRKSGCWSWLLGEPFTLPMCLAELISDALERSEHTDVAKVIDCNEAGGPPPHPNSMPLNTSDQMADGQSAIVVRIPHVPVDGEDNTAMTPDKRKRSFETMDVGRSLTQGRPYKDLSSGKGLLQLAGQSVHMSHEVPIKLHNLSSDLGSYQVTDPSMSTIFVPIQLTIRLISETLTLTPLEANALPHLMVQMGQRCRSKKSVVRLRVSKAATGSALSTGGINNRTWDHVVCCSVEDVASTFRHAFIEANFDGPDFTRFSKSINMSVRVGNFSISPCSDVFLRRKETFGAGGVHIPSNPNTSTVVVCPATPKDSTISPDAERCQTGEPSQSSSEEVNFTELKPNPSATGSDTDSDVEPENKFISHVVVSPAAAASKVPIKAVLPIPQPQRSLYPNVIAAAKAASAAAAVPDRTR